MNPKVTTDVTQIVAGVLRSAESQSVYRDAIAQGATSCNALRAARPLPQDAGVAVDNAVVAVRPERYTILAELYNRGLTFPLPNWLFQLTIRWDMLSDYGGTEAVYDMSSAAEFSLPDRLPAYLPVYLYMSRNRFDVRTLGASRLSGAPLDVGSITQSTKAQFKAMEDQAVNGSSIVINGQPVYGMLNAPGANTFSFENNLAWTDPSKTGLGVIADVVTAVEAAQDAGFEDGPYTLFIPLAYSNALQRRMSADSDETWEQAVNNLFPSIGGIRIVVSRRIPADTVILIQATDDVIDVIDGDQPTAVTWDDNPEWVTDLAVISCQIVRVKQTYYGKSGIVIGTPT